MSATLRALLADDDDLYEEWLQIGPHDHDECRLIPCARYTFNEEWCHGVIRGLWEVKSHERYGRTLYHGHDEASARSIANYEIHRGRGAVVLRGGRPIAKGGIL